MLQHTSIYRLQIAVPEGQGKYEAVTALLGRAPKDPPPVKDHATYWHFEHEVTPLSPGFDFVTEFMGLLENKYERLAALGIGRYDISLWKLYAYDGQCNMEFSPEDMKRMGENDIALCVSCWDVQDDRTNELNASTEASKQ